MITFSARREGDDTVVQAQAIIRPQDPLTDVWMILGGHRAEDKQWTQTLESVAKYFGIEEKAEVERVLIDRRRQWKNFGNIRRTPALHPILRGRRGK
jgi:hypothetical protein